MEERKPTLEKVTFEFSQDSNCVDGGEVETLIVRCESSLGIDRDKGAFIVLKTDQWAIDSPKELTNLLNRVNTAIDAIINTNE